MKPEFRGGLYYIRGSLTMTVPGRNDPCYCGSGKKYKKCHWGEGARHRRLYVGYREQFGGIEMHPNGDVFVKLTSGGLAKADHVFTQSEAEREGGESKVLNVVSDKNAMRLPAYLAGNFDIVYAIDTNTKYIGSDSVSAACVAESSFRTQSPEQVDGVQASFRIHGVMLFRNCRRGEEERYAWCRLARMITEKPWYTPSARVGLVTDHDRNNHPGYNARAIPIYERAYLPQGITMIYASTDGGTSSGTEDVTNMLLDLCEKRARAVRREIERDRAVTLEGRTVALDEIPDLGAK